MDNEKIIKWKKEYESGLPDLDQQHKDIINALNDLYLGIENLKKPEELIELINNLDFYTTTHFKDEENYAEEYKFNKIEDLKKSHVFFKNAYDEIRFHYHYYRKNTHQGVYIKFPYEYAMQVYTTMKYWLELHLNSLDKELFDHIREVMQNKSED